jgi:hypothetical protein
MRSPISSQIAVLLTLFSVLSIEGFADPLLPETEFSVRPGRAGIHTVEELLANPTKVEFELDSWKHEGSRIIRTVNDVHAVYPYPVELFLQELLDYENNKNIFPRVSESVLEYSSEDPFGKHSLRIHMEVKVLGFGADYTYVTDNWTAKHGRGYLMKYNLNRCPDGTLYQLLGSWYVEEITYKGEPHTYIRNYAILGIQKGSLPMEIAMRAFGIWQLKSVFENIAQAVAATATQ